MSRAIGSRSTATKLTTAERETLAAATAVTGGMVVFSDDVPKLAAEDRELVRQTASLASEVDHFGVPGLARAIDP